VRTDGALFCWGRNDRGQLGTGDEQPSALPLRVTGNLVAASVSAGDGRTCTRTVTSAVFCWGAIWLYRQNGLEFTRDQPTPERVTGTRMFSSVSAGSLATCAADGIGALYCWEANPYGQMGTGGFDGSTSPLPVATRARFETVSAGIIQTCAIAVDGTGYCWGDNTFGQLGVSPGAVLEHCLDGSLNCATRPMPVYGRQQLVSISTGLGNHSCAVSTHGNLYCWGLNWLGELGTGRATYREVIPVLVSPLPVP
jgi:alpha-tubulin suppressor-like RCC1 family protein